jgi:hypothetical protein
METERRTDSERHEGHWAGAATTNYLGLAR